MERKQCVVVNGSRSNEQPVISGVPQGSVLGPVLFVMFINDLERVVTNDSTVRFFADDTRISKHIDCVEDHYALQDDITSILGWAKRNNMQLYMNKSLSCWYIGLVLRPVLKVCPLPPIYIPMKFQRKYCSPLLMN